MSFNETLDNIIAVVVVILILSFAVQAAQSFFKKLMRVKSKELEESLLDLFVTVLGGQHAPPGKWYSRVAEWISAYRPRTFRAPRQATMTGSAKTVFDAVMEQFAKLGRVDNRGKWTIDSLAKDDLTKVLVRIAPDTLVPNLLARVQEALKKIDALVIAVDAVDRTHLPSGASAEYARLEETLAPLFHDYRTITTGGNVNPNVVIGDLLRFGGVVFDAPLEILRSIQVTVAAERAGAGDPAIKLRLQSLEEQLKSIADAMAKVRGASDAAFGTLRGKLNDIETWYDTVMQGFAERYERGMKTWAIVIAAVVVVLLNANLFKIYRNIETSGVLRARLVELGPELLKEGQAKSDAGGNVSDAGRVGDATTTNAPPVNEDSLAENLEPTKTATLDEALREKEKVDHWVDVYSSLGFEPLKKSTVQAWLTTLSPGPGWLAYRAHDFRTLLGWILMTLLLSLGAPFWHDVLESLFGVKNLLRKRTELRNVETESGTGNPKT